MPAVLEQYHVKVSLAFVFAHIAVIPFGYLLFESIRWTYRDGYPELRLIQSAFLFTLYLLIRHGDTWRPQVFYDDVFLRAFPIVLKELPPSQVFSPDGQCAAVTSGARWCISRAFWDWRQ